MRRSLKIPTRTLNFVLIVDTSRSLSSSYLLDAILKIEGVFKGSIDHREGGAPSLQNAFEIGDNDHETTVKCPKAN